jgi:hypothetical protein
LGLAKASDFFKIHNKEVWKMLVGSPIPISLSSPTRDDQLISQKFKEKVKNSWMNKKSEWLWKGLKEQRRGS